MKLQLMRCSTDLSTRDVLLRNLSRSRRKILLKNRRDFLYRHAYYCLDIINKLDEVADGPEMLRSSLASN